MDYSSRFCLCIVEEDLNFGVVYLDTTTHEFYVGHFKDDAHRSLLRTLVTRIKPVEIFYMNELIEDDSINMFKGLPGRPSLTVLSFDLFNMKHFLARLEGIFKQKETANVKYPDLIESMVLMIQEDLEGLDDDDLDQER